MSEIHKRDNIIVRHTVEFQNCHNNPLLPVCWQENATLTKHFSQRQSWSENNFCMCYIFGCQALKR